MSQDLFNIKRQLHTSKGTFDYWSLTELQNQGYDIAKLPFSIRILLENALRNFDDFAVTKENVATLLHWKHEASDKDIPYKPARVLMQYFAGGPAEVAIASLRAEAVGKGKDAAEIDPRRPVDDVVDHSVRVDYFRNNYSSTIDVDMEYELKAERYRFLKSAQNSFDN